MRAQSRCHHPLRLARRNPSLSLPSDLHAYMLTCSHAYLHIHNRQRLQAYMLTCVHAYTQPNMPTCLHAYMLTCIYTIDHACMLTCSSAYTHPITLTCSYAYLHVHTRARLQLCMLTCRYNHARLGRFPRLAFLFFFGLRLFETRWIRGLLLNSTL